MSSAFGTGRGMVVAGGGEGWVPGEGLQAECYTSVRMTSISVCRHRRKHCDVGTFRLEFREPRVLPRGRGTHGKAVWRGMLGTCVCVQMLRREEERALRVLVREFLFQCRAKNFWWFWRARDEGCEGIGFRI